MRTLSPALSAVYACFLALPLAAQIGGDGSDGVFHPSSNVSLDTSSRPLGFNYRSITIPTGVTVTLVGSNPAIIRSQGAVSIAGRLSADGQANHAHVGGAGGPGGYAGGNGGIGLGGSGHGPGAGIGAIAMGGAGTGGAADHAPPSIGIKKTYGSAWPFDLRGGSGGGGSAYPVSYGGLRGAGAGGGGGGGTIVLLADGAIKVSGSVTASGHSNGSAGSVLLRSMAEVNVSGNVDVSGNVINLFFRSGDGYVRLDSYGTPPVITGTVKPTPMLKMLPVMREGSSLRLGSQWDLQVAAVPSDKVALYISNKRTSIPVPSLGTLGLNPDFLIFFGAATVATAGVDPEAKLSHSVPNTPSLRGLQVHVQAINYNTSASAGPRLTNTISATVL